MTIPISRFTTLECGKKAIERFNVSKDDTLVVKALFEIVKAQLNSEKRLNYEFCLGTRFSTKISKYIDYDNKNSISKSTVQQISLNCTNIKI